MLTVGERGFVFSPQSDILQSQWILDENIITRMHDCVAFQAALLSLKYGSFSFFFLSEKLMVSSHELKRRCSIFQKHITVTEYSSWFLEIVSDGTLASTYWQLTDYESFYFPKPNAVSLRQFQLSVTSRIYCLVTRSFSLISSNMMCATKPPLKSEDNTVYKH